MLIEIEWIKRGDAPDYTHIGFTTCPNCGKNEVYVMNDRGIGGARNADYIGWHHKPAIKDEKPKLCDAGNKPISSYRLAAVA